MPRAKRLLTWVAILIQGFAVWFVLSRPQVWVFMVREHKLVPYLGVFAVYLLGERVMHGLVTSEIVRKTQLEADQIAAQQIQKTLQPEKVEELHGAISDSPAKTMSNLKLLIDPGLKEDDVTILLVKRTEQ